MEAVSRPQLIPAVHDAAPSFTLRYDHSMLVRPGSTGLDRLTEREPTPMHSPLLGSANHTLDRPKRMVVVDHPFEGVSRERQVAAENGAEFHEYQCHTEDQALEAVKSADVVLVNLAPITKACLSAMAPGASVIRYGAGYDNVDLEAATQLGITVANVQNYANATVADHTAALILSQLRKINDLHEAVTRQGWVAATGIGDIRDFAELTVGLIGVGRIGKALVDRLAGFSFRIIAHDPYLEKSGRPQQNIEFVSLDTLIAEADVISLHAPLTAETRHIIDHNRLRSMRKNAVLVNTARGALIDGEALADALEKGWIAGASLDVFEQEPLPDNDRLRKAPNIRLTPHVAFYSRDSAARLQSFVAAEAQRALLHEPLVGRIN